MGKAGVFSLSAGQQGASEREGARIPRKDVFCALLARERASEGLANGELFMGGVLVCLIV